MVKKGSEIMVPASAESLEALRQQYPTEVGYNRTLLPRFGLVSQDVTEKVTNPKTKKVSINVIHEAGELFLERQSDEEEEVEDADGKTVMRKKWEREELGKEVEGTILYQRKQLKFYDKSTEKFTSSPVYDTDEDVIPLFLDKKEVDRGTPEQLKAKYPGTSLKGKAISLLEDNRILYVLIGEEIFQLNLRGTSMYSFLTYARKVLVPSVITKFSSEAKSNGSTDWNMMTFEPVRALSQPEIETVLEKVAEIKAGIEQEKGYYAAQNAATDKAEGESDEDATARRKRNKDF